MKFCLLIVFCVLPHIAAEDNEKWKAVQLGDGGPSILLPPGAVPNPGSGIESPEKGWSKFRYEYSVRVSDNMADSPFYIRINLAGLAIRDTTTATLRELSAKVLRLDKGLDRITWNRKTDRIFMWVRKDRGLKIIRKVFVNPYDEADKVVKELWIEYPDRLWVPSKRVKTMCDRWLAKIEGSFHPYAANLK
jgi:hypothetical protein